MADELRPSAFEHTPDITARMALIERSILVLLVLGLFIGVVAVVKPFTTAILLGGAGNRGLADPPSPRPPRARARSGATRRRSRS